jgi:hypothetical protein
MVTPTPSKSATLRVVSAIPIRDAAAARGLKRSAFLSTAAHEKIAADG